MDSRAQNVNDNYSTHELVLPVEREKAFTNQKENNIATDYKT